VMAHPVIRPRRSCGVHLISYQVACSPRSILLRFTEPEAVQICCDQSQKNA